MISEDYTIMMTKERIIMAEVKNLAINYKTVEDFKKFREYGAQELQMTKELEGNMIDADINSPFYGIYVGDNLAARMCLYTKEDNNQPIFDPSGEYMGLWKREVLVKYHGKGCSSEMVDYANSLTMPIYAIRRQTARQFFEKHGFETLMDDTARDIADGSLVWYLKGHIMN